jgi:hypothetical protein
MVVFVSALGGAGVRVGVGFIFGFAGAGRTTPALAVGF